MLGFIDTEMYLFNQWKQRGLEETKRLFLKVFFPLEYATDGKPEPKRLCEIVWNTTVFESSIFFKSVNRNSF